MPNPEMWDPCSPPSRPEPLPWALTAGENQCPALSATYPHILPVSLVALGLGGGDLSLTPRACFLSPLCLSLHMFCARLGHPLWPVPHPCAPLAEAQRLPYYATYCPTRLLIHSMCTSHYLDIFITFVICLNVVTMSLEHYNQPMVSPSPAPRGRGFMGSRTLPLGQGGQDLSGPCWALCPGSSRPGRPCD